MPWKLPILNVVDASTTALLVTLLALFLSGSDGNEVGLSNAIEAWQLGLQACTIEFSNCWPMAPIQIFKNWVERHALLLYIARGWTINRKYPQYRGLSVAHRLH